MLVSKPYDSKKAKFNLTVVMLHGDILESSKLWGKAYAEVEYENI